MEQQGSGTASNAPPAAPPTAAASPTEWLAGAGELAEMMRACDWAATPLGARERWPQSLRTAVNLILGSRFPMALLWGRDLLLLYNDAFRALAHGAPPPALGRAAREVWAEAWRDLEPLVTTVMERGESVSLEDQLFPLGRVGTGNASFTLCYSPVRIEDGSVGGTFVTLQATTVALEHGHRLRASEARLRGILDNMQDAFFQADLAGRFVEVSPSAPPMYGYDSVEEMLGLPAETLYADPQARVATLEALRGAGRLTDVMVQGRRKDGTTFWVSMNLQFRRDPAGRIVGTEGVVRDITERTKAAEALRRYELLAQHSRDLILFIRRDDGRILDANAAATSAYGYTRDELLRLTIFDLRVDDGPALTDAQMAEADTRGIRFEALHRRKDGSTFPVEVSAQGATTDGARTLVSVVRDITERRRAEEVLRRSEAKHLTILQTVRSGYVLLDLGGHLLEVNDAYVRMSGYSRDELLRMRIADVEANETPAETLAHIQAIRARGHAQFETRHRRKDGTVFDTEIRVTAIDVEGGLLVAFAWDISDRKATEQALRDRQADLNRAQAVAHTGSWRLDVRRDELLWSDETYRIFGIPKGTRLTYERFLAAVHPEDRSAVAQQWTAALGGQPYDVEHRILVGEAVRWVRERAELELDDRGALRGGFGTVQDITERKEAEAALRQRETTLAQAGQMAHLGAWHNEVVNPGDLSAGPLTWSDEVYRIFGYEPGAVKVTHELVFAHVHPDDRPRVVEAVAHAIATRRPYAIEHRIVRADGTERIVQEHAELVFDEHGALRRLIGAVQDVTERKQMEVALREADRRKDEFLAILSHELRNPLAPIRNSVFLLQHAPPGGAQALRAQQIIERQSAHLARLVDDLLDLNRISRGKVELHRERIDLADLVLRTVEDHRVNLTDKGVVLDVEVAHAPLWLDADPTRISQIIGNLLGNAGKFTPRGGRVHVAVTVAGRLAVVRVSDTGAGIAPELLGKVFKPFIQADQTLARSQGGLGLGLALVKGFVEMHGGSVAASSDGVGRGAQLEVRLPLLERVVVDEPRPAAPEARRALRVLVIEDSRDAAESLGDVLRCLGHEVQLAFDGATGVAATQETAPDLVLCDIGLPDMTGYAVARALRAVPRLARCRLVALTGYAQPDDVTQALAAGFDRHLAKPPTMEAIEELLAEVPGRAAAGVAPRPT
jgi:PAS domain S-box-containing protein